MSNPAPTLPINVRLFRSTCRPFFRVLFKLLGRVRITGKANVPRQGAYIVAINHVSLYEAPFILSYWPVAPEVLGAVDIWSKRGQAWLARNYGGIAVHRGEYNRAVIDQVLAILRAGKPLLLAPEGGRSHTPGMRRAQPGIGYLMHLARVPVIPVGIVGTTEDYLDLAIHGKRPLLEMHIGEPIVLAQPGENGKPHRIIWQANADLVMRQIAALLPEEYQGVYANQSDLT
jgi:1-acyl-sn-glycerol-3-phosphate acyltransferase